MSFFKSTVPNKCGWECENSKVRIFLINTFLSKNFACGQWYTCVEKEGSCRVKTPCEAKLPLCQKIRKISNLVR